MTWSSRSLVVPILVILGLLWPASAQAAFTNLPTDFDDESVVGGLGQPTAFDFLPAGEAAGDMLVTSKEGVVHLVEGGAATEAIDISDRVCDNGEMGLLGIAIHPEFAADSNRFVYLYYTHAPSGNCGNRDNRVSRFTMDAGGDLSDEDVLVDNISAKGGNHNGGDLQFGNDDLLYVSVGDAGEDLITGEGQDDNRNARKLSLLNGKILRIEADGSIPSGNPFTGNGTRQCGSSGSAASSGKQVGAEKKGRNHKHKHKNKKKKRRIKRKRRQQNNAPKCQEIFATGLRNPFRIAFDLDASGGRFFINDVGGDGFEEVNEGAEAADYGWNVREGPCPINDISNDCTSNSQFDDPYFAYRRNGAAPFNNCVTITGGAFVPDGGNWPNVFDDGYLFADLGCGRLFIISNNVSDPEPEVFGEGEPGEDAIHMKFGPDDGHLYYTTFGGAGEVRRIVAP